jgi:hypothetical protein
MLKRKTFIAAVTASTLFTTGLLTTGVAFAADQAAQGTKGSNPGEQASVAKDFGTLSKDGSQAFQDLTMTRLAIFDGRIDDAKKYIDDADQEFGKAKNDQSVFTKAEADLKGQNGRRADTAAMANNKNDSAKQGDMNQNGANAADMKKPIAWLPVDGEITLAEDYTESKPKSAAVADANKSLQKGDRAGAMEKLKLAGVDVDVTLAVMPLHQTLDDVHKAAGLINDGKYYEASQVLRQAEDGVRFDVADMTGTPKAGAAKATTNEQGSEQGAKTAHKS